MYYQTVLSVYTAYVIILYYQKDNTEYNRHSHLFLIIRPKRTFPNENDPSLILF